MHPDVEILRAAIRVPTVADRDPALTDPEPFARLHALLAEHFPLLHAQLERVDLGDAAPRALLWRWAGASPDRPVVLMAHQDVVPVTPDDPWTHDAFAADVVETAEGPAVWGRGTLDDKGQLVAICTAVERLLADGFEPAQDVWLSFGADEEVSGPSAPAAVAELARRGVEPWFVLDEGGAVAGQAFPGVSAPVAVIGSTEKGTTTLSLTVTGRGGHSSTPPTRAPAARLGRALWRLDREQFGVNVPGPTVDLLRRLAGHLPLPLRALLAGATRTPPAVLGRVLVAAGPETAAMARTTMVATTLVGAPAHNVIPARARAEVNLRIMPGESVAAAVEHVRAAVDDDEVVVDVVEANEPSPLSPTTEPEAQGAFALLERTVGAVFPDAVVTPYVMMAGTDSRTFTAICSRVYRFAPLRMSKEQRASIHSYDEHVHVAAWLEGVDWYVALLRGL
ncbi:MULTISPECIES: M20/M25/M40 family metallo-hydrolase [unclassified Aeromicrobium]|uniref:M20/M25/M40 family metallo-hydrolase n=1 Tax=unclassified Aeromicrobium TaxID=2633570 RepID=UPI000A76BB58|nr:MULTISPECIES: M20/M25/M40 family metallo-hydrolase [unclassified Aeromicrobium]